MYADIAPVIDFSLGELLVSAFKYNDQFGFQRLADIENYIESINKNNVTFAVNHDTYNSDKSNLHMTFDNNSDRSSEVLATCILLAIKNGVPLIYKETAKNDFVKTGVRFKNNMKHQPKAVITFLGKDLMIIKRGKKGVCIINKSSHSIPGYSGLSDFNCLYNMNIGVKEDSDCVNIPARSAVFYTEAELNLNYESIWDLPGENNINKKQIQQIQPVEPVQKSDPNSMAAKVKRGMPNKLMFNNDDFPPLG